MGNKCFVNVGKKCLTFTKHMQLGYKLSIFNENAFILFFSVTFDSSKDILLLLVNFANLYHTESSFSLRYTKPTRAAMMFCFVTVKQTGKVMIKTGSPSISFRLIMPLPLTRLRDLGDNSINRDIASSRSTWLMEPRPQLAGFYLFWDAIPELTNP